MKGSVPLGKRDLGKKVSLLRSRPPPLFILIFVSLKTSKLHSYLSEHGKNEMVLENQNTQEARWVMLGISFRSKQIRFLEGGYSKFELF